MDPKSSWAPPISGTYRRVRGERPWLGFGVVDIDGEWLNAGDELCELLGRDEDSLLGTRLQELMRPRDGDELRRRMRRLAEGEGEGGLTRMRIESDADETPCLLRCVTLIRDHGGSPMQFVVRVERDGSRTQVPEPEAAEGSGTYTNPWDSGGEATLVDIRILVAWAVRLARVEIGGRARFVQQFEAVPLVFANAGLLGDVFYKLVLHAAQAVPRGGASSNEIRIVTRTDRSGRATVELRGAGAGIAPQILRSLLDPIGSTKLPGSRTGRALSACHGTITSLGGEICVTTEPGAGSVFRVALPAAHIPRVIADESVA